MKTIAISLFAAIFVAVVSVAAPVYTLRRLQLSWTWTLFALPVVALGLLANLYAGLFIATYCGALIAVSAKAHFRETAVGGDYAARAAARVGPAQWRRRRNATRAMEDGVFVSDSSLVVGCDDEGAPMRIPFGRESGRHTFIVGKTGYGKTVTQAYIAKQHILAGKGAIVVDPKGDDLTRETLREAANAMGKRFIEWSPEGPCFFNPYKHGNATEIAHKALAAETYTEPHYLRQAQRFLGFSLRSMKLAGIWPPTPDSLVQYLRPKALGDLRAQLPKEAQPQLSDYLTSLDSHEIRDLGGTRNRLAILAESDIGPWLSPRDDVEELDLRDVVLHGDVAYIQLESDRYEEAAKMIGAAIIQDLVTISALLQKIGPRETLIVVDEFAAIAASKVTSLFARGRSAGFSLVLGTQSLADLDAANDFGRTALLDQVVDNVSSLIVHQQVKPDSVETLAAIAGTEYSWSTTLRTSQSIANLSTGDGTKTRSRKFVIHPDDFKNLGVAEAIVIVPGSKQKPRKTHMLHPDNVEGLTHGLRDAVIKA